MTPSDSVPPAEAHPGVLPPLPPRVEMHKLWAGSAWADGRARGCPRTRAPASSFTGSQAPSVGFRAARRHAPGGAQHRVLPLRTFKPVLASRHRSGSHSSMNQSCLRFCLTPTQVAFASKSAQML